MRLKPHSASRTATASHTEASAEWRAVSGPHQCTDATDDPNPAPTANAPTAPTPPTAPTARDETASNRGPPSGGARAIARACRHRGASCMARPERQDQGRTHRVARALVEAAWHHGPPIPAPADALPRRAAACTGVSCDRKGVGAARSRSTRPPAAAPAADRPEVRTRVGGAPAHAFSHLLAPSHAFSRLLAPSRAFSRLLTGAYTCGRSAGVWPCPPLP